MDEFRDKVAIVTGASSGIGRKTAELLVERGARVVIFSRSAGKLLSVARDLGDRVLVVPGDAADASSIDRLFAETEARMGPCDVLVNNAGSIEPQATADMDLAVWDRTFAVNVRAAFLTCRRALRSMITRRSGAIVNVSSISGIVGPRKFPGFAAYNASKAALIAFTEGLAVEVKQHGIRVNCVSPGSVDTPMWAGVSGGARADMTPAEVAETILFLASDRSRPMNGQNLHVFSV